MNKYASLFLLLVMLIAGCKKDLNTSQQSITPDVIHRTTKIVQVTTIDQAVTQSDCITETLRTGEIIQMCKPANWNGSLILYAHGYVSEFEPLALPIEAERYRPVFLALGYAFATTSFSENGLAVLAGIDNMIDLRKRFIKEFGAPSTVYLTGASEGGLITTLAAERYPGLFNGALSLCSPTGDFQRQLNYFGDFRVLFDYFFPKVLPGSVTEIPATLVAGWESTYVPKILQAIQANPVLTLKLMNVAQAPYDPANSATIANTVIGLLWYNVFALPNAVTKLKGMPYDNIGRQYSGTGSTSDDQLLNQTVQRVSADKKALSTVAKSYETSGRIAIPLIQPHTTLDPTIPIWHVPAYAQKTLQTGSSTRFTPAPINRYGHCVFADAEIAVSFALLVQQTEGKALVQAQELIKKSERNGGKIVRSVQELQ